MRKIEVALFSVALFLGSALWAWSQSSGTVPNHYVVLGKGTGVVGFGSATPSTAGKVLTSNGTSTDPSFQSLPAASLVVGTSVITSGTTTRILYDNAGVLGEYAISGSGSVAMATSPVLVTPTLGVAGGTSLALGGCTISTNALCATGTANISGATTLGGAITYGGVTASNAVTGTGNLVLATTPTLTTPVLGVATATSINKVALTAPASSATLTIADGKTATHNASTTFAGTDGKTLTVSNSGTLAGGDAFTLAIAASKTLTVSNSLTLAGTDSTVQTFPSVSATVAALNIEDQTLAGGANVTAKTQSTGNLTIDCGARPLQYITNGGAFTLTAPASDGSCILLTTNNGSAGAITFSGFSVGSSTGDALTTTNTNKFSIHVWRINGTSGYRIAAHQ